MARRMVFPVVALACLGLGYLMGSASVGVTRAGPAMQGGCQTFRETGKSVCGRFLRYWTEHGGLPQQGFPISQELQERSDLNGQVYTVQYFERAVFEYHPENQPPFDVLLSQLGTFRYREKYGGGAPGPQPPPPAATPTPAATIFVEVGEPVRRNGIVFTCTRVDVLAKRVDVIYQVRNEIGGPINLTLSNADQHLVSNTGEQYAQADPGRVVNITLSNGQAYDGGTTFNADLASKGVKELTFVIDNVPRIGSVRVRIPLVDTP
jgi:hypothetical protein